MTAQERASERARGPLYRFTAGGGFDVTPSNSNDLPQVAEYLRVNGAGQVTLVTADGDTLAMDCADGEYIWVRTRRVNATGTSATGIQGFI